MKYIISTRLVAAGVVLAALAGCAHTPGRMLWREAAPVDGEVEDAISSLARTQEALESLRGQGICIVTSPEFLGRRKLDLTLVYRAPDDLSVRGFEPVSRAQVLRLVVFDGRLAFELSGTTVDVSEMLGKAPPEVIAGELLRPEAWGELSSRKVRVLEKDVQGGVPRLVLLVNKRLGFFRKVIVEGPEWKLRESELMNKHKDVLLRVKWEKYIEKDGIRAPVEFTATFPQEGIVLDFNLAEERIAINPDLGPGDFLN